MSSTSQPGLYYNWALSGSILIHLLQAVLRTDEKENGWSDNADCPEFLTYVYIYARGQTWLQRDRRDRIKWVVIHGRRFKRGERWKWRKSISRQNTGLQAHDNINAVIYAKFNPYPTNVENRVSS